MKKSIFTVLCALSAAFAAQATTFKPLAQFNNLVTGDEAVITMAYAGTTYALNAEDATGTPPKSEAVTLTDGALEDPEAKFVFKAEEVEGGYRFTRGDDFLYMLDDAKGLRVGKPKSGTTYTDVFNVRAEEEYRGYLYGVINTKEQFIGVWHKDGDPATLTYFARYPYNTSGNSGWKKLISDETFVLYVNSPSGDPSQPKYTVTAANVEGGQISVSYPKAGENVIIEVDYTVAKGYDFVEGSLAFVYKVGEEEVYTVIEDSQFLMPAANVTVTAEFEGRSPKATFDFSDKANLWGIPNEHTVGTNTYYNGDLSIILTSVGEVKNGNGYNFNKSGYLLLGKKDSKLTLPAFAHDVTKIVVTGEEYASEYVETNILVGEEPVSKKAVGATSSNIFLINRDSRAAGTIYDLAILNDHAARITTIDIYAPVEGAPETPEVDVPAGVYTSEQLVSLSCYTEGAEIFYTLDGSRPTEKSTKYDKSITIDKTKTLRAVAVLSGIKSEILTVHYAIANVSADGSLLNPYSVADVQELGNPGWKAWVHGFIIDGFDSNIKVRALSSEATNAIAIADSKGETDLANMIIVELPQGRVRNGLNVAEHSENIGKEVWVYGTLSNYGGKPGVSKTSKYHLDELPKPTNIEQSTQTELVPAMKVFRDGQLLIINNGVVYDALGRQL